MRRVVVVLVTLAVLAWVPMSASGQVFGGRSSCDPGRRLGLGFEVGWLSYFRDGFVLSAGGGPFFWYQAEEAPSQELGLQGIWLGLTGDYRVNDRVSGYLKGTWLIPSTKKTSDFWAEQSLIFGPASAGRDYSTSLQWYTLEAGGNLRLFGGSTVLLGGFRYDSFDLTLKSPSDFPSAPGFGGPTDESSFTMDLYIPFVGLMVDQGSVQIGFVGFPTMFGEMKFNNTYARLFAGPNAWAAPEIGAGINKGYFFEAFAQLGTSADFVPYGSSTNISVFAKYTVVHAYGTPDLDFGFGQNAFIPGNASSEVGVTVNRENYILGAKLDMRFSSPL
jgi:hypothetical protein